ncbi:TIGR04283 family arsenosugar biosynthesis glycosyltransferase [Mucilaginibacter sp. RB4R14]|uniref:TIGR04283 family arsenosugar biosynthesis glycosyltransferase n=1 Tax=Mucilaginibacter aurantiaciroseus TaxID=2949308 RepID=UPI0020912860|nr:TIGR04283 family arsenosugar biosynthesis glycosyltransferase [Mucilaginibacter aurantiaciroseus]MCO5936660.1 TIGR04283 family arsenosugar biosynthesis glycosyltransferase [Mucilaginibacter aurantiaciroseus]
MKVTIIVPVFNEADNIGRLIRYLTAFGNDNLEEIIVVDGGSTDDSLVYAKKAGAVAVISPEKGRAAQMNFGASLAKGDLLYFVHADTLPPQTYITDIVNVVKAGYDMGRYLSIYDSKSWLLKLNALLSRLDTFGGMGGDQTLLITKNLFQQTGGFDGTMKIMEEFEFCTRARKRGKYKIITKPVLISARKYDTNGWFTVQKANYAIVRMYQKGASQESMVLKYKEMLNYR